MRISDPGFVTDHILLDPGTEYLFNDDDSISVGLVDTKALICLVDAFREENGLLPLLPTSKHMNDYDQDGWYNFYLNVYPADGHRTDAAILVIVDSPSADDDRCDYYIELSYNVRKALYEHLNEEAPKVFGSCFEALFAEEKRKGEIENDSWFEI